MPKESAPPVKLRSPLVRALLPNIGGIVVIGLIGLMLWGFAAYISRDSTETSERLAPSNLRVGSAQNAADIVTEDGPILFADLATNRGARTIVLDHTGDDPASGWAVYFGYPADRDANCIVEQVIGTRNFVDCDDRTLDVNELALPPDGVNPVIENGRLLSINLSGVTDG